MYLCLSFMSDILGSLKRSISSPDTGIMDVVSYHLDAGDGTQVLCKNHTQTLSLDF